MFLRFFWTLLLGMVAFLTPAWAEMAAPKGDVVLSVTGNISQTNADGAALFDRDMLQALDWREVRTFTSFTNGEQHFAGPTLASVLTAVGAEGDDMVATAINDYSVSISIGYALEHDAFLAMDIDGRPMRVRDKGPIWIVFPLSEEAAKDRPFDREMVWQLVKLQINS